MSITEQIEKLKEMSAYELLYNTSADGQIFTTRVIMSYLKIHYGNEAMSIGGFFTEDQSNAIQETDIVLDKLFKAFKDGYANNIISGL